MVFADGSNAGDASFAINGGEVDGAFGESFVLAGNSAVGAATIKINPGGSCGSGTDAIGGPARYRTLTILASHNRFIVGSIEGDGNVVLFTGKTTIGSNNLNTVFSGVISSESVRGNSIIKIGLPAVTVFTVIDNRSRQPIVGVRQSTG